LVNRAQLRFVHVDHHGVDDQLDAHLCPVRYRSGSSLVGMSSQRSGSYLIG
jgi:hypothetical protein